MPKLWMDHVASLNLTFDLPLKREFLALFAVECRQRVENDSVGLKYAQRRACHLHVSKCHLQLAKN